MLAAHALLYIPGPTNACSQEATIMAGLHHPNVITLMAVCPFPATIVTGGRPRRRTARASTAGCPAWFKILHARLPHDPCAACCAEYCARGSLLDVLKRARASPAAARQLSWPVRLSMVRPHTSRAQWVPGPQAWAAALRVSQSREWLPPGRRMSRLPTANPCLARPAPRSGTRRRQGHAVPAHQGAACAAPRSEERQPACRQCDAHQGERPAGTQRTHSTMHGASMLRMASVQQLRNLDRE